MKPSIGEPSSFGGVDWFDAEKRWVQLPGDSSSRDIQADFGVFHSVAVFAATIRGRKHRLLGRPNEDAFAIRHVEVASRAFVVVVLCDGLSSAALSHWSSSWSALEVADRIIGHFSDVTSLSDGVLSEIIARSILDAKEQLVKERVTDATPIGDFATTLTVAVVPAHSIEDGPAVVGYIGDSPAFIREPDHWLQIALHTAEADVQSSATEAFPLVDKCRFVSPALRQGDVLLVTSDGVGNYLSRGNRDLQLGEYIAKQWATPRDEVELLADLSFDLRSADDDRTVVALWLGVN
jgi:serine/threonine protein phosphatase PrpC